MSIYFSLRTKRWGLQMFLARLRCSLGLRWRLWGDGFNLPLYLRIRRQSRFIWSIVNFMRYMSGLLRSMRGCIPLRSWVKWNGCHKKRQDEKMLIWTVFAFANYNLGFLNKRLSVGRSVCRCVREYAILCSRWVVTYLHRYLLKYVNKSNSPVFIHN